MSRLTELLRRLEGADRALAQDLASEIRAATSRQPFGIAFERHQPEAVELPRKPIRRGDKVRICPRESEPRKKDRRLWRVTRLRTGDAAPLAELELLDPLKAEECVAPVADLVAVAEFRDVIYPGLRSTGRITQDRTKPHHVVINAENYHALHALLYVCEGKVDCIYIDPPYNTRDKDWKYNNDYVDADDAYKHSKWLAMMERRLKLAKRLLRPEWSVLIVTIDENEYLRLGLLLEQVFPGAKIQMVTTVISAKGVVRPGQFSRVEEYIFFVTLGDARISNGSHNMLDNKKPKQSWLGLRRREPTSVRGARPNQFFPIFVSADTGRLHSIGAPVEDGVPRTSVRAPLGTVALWPLKPDGTEMLWGLTPQALARLWDEGFARVNRWDPETGTGSVQYLPAGLANKIRKGKVEIRGRDEFGAVVLATDAEAETSPPKRVWNQKSHNAEFGGTKVLSALVPGRRFPYPKSLYAVEDTLRFFLKEKRDALVVDFFLGSGTTTHAVARLNREDGGNRRTICVTNNEVSDAEAKRLRRSGFRPGDAEWEALGICEYITKPRLLAAFTGVLPDGQRASGDYKHGEEFAFGDGLRENVEFFELTYEAPRPVAHHRSFSAVSPLLWMRAGAKGARIESVDRFAIAENYAVLADLDEAPRFVGMLRKQQPEVKLVFIVTDDDASFQGICAQLPREVEAVRLYESYLKNFEINTSRE